MAQVDSFKETIDGVEYTIYMLDPRTSLRLLRRILGAVSPALGAFAGTGGDMSAEVSPELFSKIAGDLFDRLDEKLLDDAVDHLASVTHADGKPLKETMAIHFRGRIGAMVRWLAFALRVQYADFFAEAKAAIARIGGAKGAASPSPRPSPTTG